MPGRHTPEVKDQREKAMLEIFSKDPNMSAAKANEAFKAQFKTMMRNKRVYEIRKMAQEAAAKAAPAPATEVPATPAPAAPETPPAQ